jgi:hypothetical protein
MDEDATRLRKVRKGTRSCWHCKRRKVRCIFAYGDDTVCISCRRRGTTCVGQQYAEETAPPLERAGRVADERIVRMEAMIEHVARKVDGSSNTLSEFPFGAGRIETEPGTAACRAQASRSDISAVLPAVQSLTTPQNLEPCPQPASDWATTTAASTTPPLLTPVQTSPSFSSPFAYMPTSEGSQSHIIRWAETSRLLYNALPSNDDVHRILTTDEAAILFIPTCLTAPEREQIGSSYNKSADLTVRPGPSTHPVLLARWMLKLANLLQTVLPHYTQSGDHGLSEPPMTILQRLVDNASNLVTTKDELINSAEALEAIMLEAIYQANIGNLRRAWVSFRRALTIAQLMELNGPDSRSTKVIDPSTQVDPFYTWSRIVFVDRNFSLMLGLPQGCSDELVLPASSPQRDEGPTAELEIAHSEVAARIIRRNEQRSLDDIGLTMAIDSQLQDVANRMPSGWWLAPSLKKHECCDTTNMFRVESHLTRQLFHYNLINQLHLPYLLGSKTSSDGYKYIYSRYACVAASRDIINRYLALPSIVRIVFCFRVTEFFVHMAAMTLLLAHLDSHRRPQEYDVHGGVVTNGGNLLTHQRLADRATIELVLVNMKSKKGFSHDQLNIESHSLLSRLLAVEEAAAKSQIVPDVSAPETRLLSLTIPYFGVINIGPNGLHKQTSKHTPIWKEPATPGSTNVSLGQEAARQGPPYDFPAHVPRENNILDPVFPNGYVPHNVTGFGIVQPQDPMALDVTVQPDIPEQLDLPLYPELMASADDWAFQGVDLAFFDSLMRNNSFSSDDANMDG